MLWLCLHLPQFPLQLRQPPDTGHAAVVDRHGSRRWVVAYNEASRQAGIFHGLDAASALGLVPQLKLIERSPRQERSALRSLAGWAEQFSSFVTYDADRLLLWVEIGASLQYFGGVRPLLEKVTESIRALGYSIEVGIAPTLEAAALLTRQPDFPPIFQRALLKERLAPLPLKLLAVDAFSIDALSAVGWQSIGETLSIPGDQLARRFGPNVTDYLRRLVGEKPDPRKPYRAPQTYRRRCEFAAPIDSIEALLFPLHRLLGELQGYLRGRDTALQCLQLALQHEKRPDTVIEIRTTSPQREASRLLTLLRETLERTPLPAPAECMMLRVDNFVPLGDTQLDIFDNASRRERSWNDLLDKLAARLGERAVKRLGLSDAHLPEKAWTLVHHDEGSGTDSRTEAERPLWLIDPRPLEHLPRLLGKPERIEAGWWTGDDSRRDYYIAETSAGSRWWLYLDADSSRWYLHGIWS